MKAWFLCDIHVCWYVVHSTSPPPPQQVPYISFKHFDFVQSRYLLPHKHDALWQSLNPEAFSELKFKKPVVLIFFGNIITLYILWNFSKGIVLQCLSLHKIIIYS
jgi:hypothetical protein